ncbi:MAG: SxtJ family membrane protein [Chloroflexia bacterium]
MQNGRVDPKSIHALTVQARPGRQALALVWDFWKAYGEKIAFYQTTVILLVIYTVIVGPIALIGRLTGHHFLPQLPASAATLWHPTSMGRAADLAELKKQG